ncbi:para-aminobenzoate synthase [Coniophora puteana RWD-64-598 SS2]|uniref:aminodeoxychorismate synthase n=1 Tax=Coniophora puteana (strain RWD-64-598) TaxID=741705 RepID=A0A5M3N6G3_CONPW|nr:para-aminobenzoate synthase [Coniophora puteana RWD-64-598 SS2]EIW87013.1 para-aminobenzoate synthase [Coniophora puteana RWD-64-598 SS2]
MVIEQPPARILLVDSYDSFTYNLASLCQKSIPDCQIHIIKNDQLSLSALLPLLPHFSAIVVGPGPGSPHIAEDIGIVKDLWKLSEDYLLPIFGVCLGHQSLVLEFGGQLERLRVVKHGQVSRVEHTSEDLFKNVDDVWAVRYHSLQVHVRPHSDIEALAWADDGEENGMVVMAVKHRSRPFWAVQYHPESVLTDGGGFEVVSNFWNLAHNWNTIHGRIIRDWSHDAEDTFGLPWPHLYTPPLSPSQSPPRTVSTSVLRKTNLSATAICELLNVADDSSPFVLLDSAAQPGRYTIIGCVNGRSPRIIYSLTDSHVRVLQDGVSTPFELDSYDIWSWIASFMNKRKAVGGVPDLPFWGGLIGYLSYELGAHSLCAPGTIALDDADTRHSDVNLIFVERSIVLDTCSGDIYFQSIVEGDHVWFSETTVLIQRAVTKASDSEPKVSTTSTKVKEKTISISLPDQVLYKSRIDVAKEYLAAGDSYELCLTARTRVTINDPHAPQPSRVHSPSWQRYKQLRKRNAAPHAAYLRLHPTTLVASSPERFLSFSRPPHAKYQLRPIKGTVRKGPGITRAVAEQALSGSRKEVAENLMIVDLIRHDLHGVVGKDVNVSQFCGVEEYKTMWQLVSVIEAATPAGAEQTDGQHANGALGWEVLRRSLPPGQWSMTGAPKKRSVEILQTLEDDERSLYSGVFGYWCVGGGGDWSVTIRSCFKRDDRYNQDMGLPSTEVSSEGAPTAPPCTEEWVIGAGGAITALSDTDAEWDEMVVKLQSVLPIFGSS